MQNRTRNGILFERLERYKLPLSCSMHVSWQVFNLLSIDSNDIKRERVFNFVLDTLYRFPHAEPSRYALDPRLRSSSLG